jgi:hypothetical protein
MKGIMASRIVIGMEDETHYHSVEKNERRVNKITIEYETPERKIEISESDFDRIVNDIRKHKTLYGFIEEIRKELFGESK